MNLLDFLGDGKKRNNLVEILLSSGENKTQEEFFGRAETGTEDHLNKVLDEIFYLVFNQKPLYLKWSKEINGKIRNLSVPQRPLVKLFEIYLLPFIKTGKIHGNAHGSERNWSVTRSLGTHLPISSVLSFDLQSAFENISEREIYRFFYDLMSCLPSDRRRESAEFFPQILTVSYQESRCLPTGSNLSPALFNRVLYPLDERLAESARQRGFNYSRWLDDITISSPEQANIGEFLGAVELVDKKYKVSDSKVYFQTSEKDIYLLGQKITPEGRMFKNTQEERNAMKAEPLNFCDFFGSNTKKNYVSWE